MKKLIIVALCALVIGGLIYINTNAFKISQLEKESTTALENNLLIESLQKIAEINALDSDYENTANLISSVFQNDKLNSQSEDSIKQLQEFYLSSNIVKDTQVTSNIELATSGSIQSPLSSFYLYSSSNKFLDYQYISNETYQTWVINVAQSIQEKNIDVQEQLALIAEANEDYDQSFELALEFEDQAGDRELARILGLSYLHMTQNIETAYKHLHNYTSEKIKIYTDASQKFDDINQSIWDDFGRRFEKNQLSRTFYNQYDEADDAGKSQLYNNAFVEYRDEKSRFQAIDNQYNEVYYLLNVIMDYGQSSLFFAMVQTDSEQSQKLLEQAEEIYLSIANDASSDEDFQLFLGQVKFWLGKKEEGTALFDQYLDQNERSAFALHSIAEKYREIGDSKQAKELMEEAYEKAVEKEDKVYLAESLSVMADTMEEQLEWLNLSDLSLTRNMASKLSIEGSLLEEEGKPKQAEEKLLEAVKLQKSLDVNATTLNNVSVIYSKLFFLTRNISYLELESESISKATELSPTNSILLSNASYTNSRYAHYSILKDLLDLDTLEIFGHIDLYRYLYSNQQEKNVFAKQLQENKQINNAMRFNRTLLTISPNNIEPYYNLLSFYNFFNDMEGLRFLANQAKTLKLDFEELPESEDVSNEEFYENYNESKALIKNIRNSTTSKNAVHYADLVELEWRVAELEQLKIYNENAINQLLKDYQSILSSNLSSEAISNYEDAIYQAINLKLMSQSSKYKTFYEENSDLPISFTLFIAAQLDAEVSKMINEDKNLTLLIKHFDFSEANFPGQPSIIEYHFKNIATSGKANKKLDFEHSKLNYSIYEKLSTSKDLSRLFAFISESIELNDTELKQKLLNLGYKI